MKVCNRTLPSLLILWLSLPPVCLAGPPADFEARLELHRNGKLSGETQFKLETQDGRWIMHSETRGTKGVLSWIGLRENSTGEGDWQDGQPRPLRYQRQVKAVISMTWTAEFDWEDRVVRTVYPDGESTLDLEPGVVDETALALAIRRGLKNGEDEWFLRQVDEDEIENVHFRVSAREEVQTPLGCMRAHVVEKVRGEGSKRYTRTWYADDHEFVPVLVEHGKQGEEHVEGRVVELSVNGRAVAAAPDCAL